MAHARARDEWAVRFAECLVQVCVLDCKSVNAAILLIVWAFSLFDSCLYDSLTIAHALYSFLVFIFSDAPQSRAGADVSTGAVYSVVGLVDKASPLFRGSERLQGRRCRQIRPGVPQSLETGPTD